MMKSHIASFCATVALATVISAQNVSASPQDYEFQLVQDALPSAQDTIISVRLMHKPTGKPVSDAVIFATRLDMAPDGMPTMMADLEALPSEETGIYRYRTTLGMEGSWRLSLAAKVQGERDTVQSRLVLKAKN